MQNNHTPIHPFGVDEGRVSPAETGHNEKQWDRQAVATCTD